MAIRTFQLFPHAGTEDALSPDAFHVPVYFAFPDAAWWRENNPARDDSRAPRYPTRAKYWAAYPLERLRSTVPLKGESRDRARARAAKARSYTARAAAYERAQGSVKWRLIMESSVQAVVSNRSGSNEVWGGETKTPFQPITRGRAVTDADIEGLFYNLARATVRTTTGLGKGPSGLTTDGRHGPSWYDKLNVNHELREQLNANGITYENSNCYVDKVTLEIVGV